MTRIGVSPRAAGAAFALCVSVAGASEFYASGDIRRGIQSPLDVLDSYNRSGFSGAGGEIFHDEFAPGETSWHANVGTLADRGGLRAHSFASIIRPSDAPIVFASQYTGGGFAVANMDDFFIPGTPGTFVDAPMRLHIRGTVGGGTSAPTEGRTLRVVTQAFLGSNIAGDGREGGLFSLTVQNGTETRSATGIFTGFDGDETVVTRVFRLPVGEFFNVNLSLSAFTSLTYDFEEPTFSMQGNVEFGHTITFATDGPVFLLPKGYTINSVSAGIKDNVYIGGGPTCSADFNDDGTVNSTDVSDFINAWFADQLKGTLVTDWDANGVVNSTDVSEFINSWFDDQAAGCG